VPKVVVHQEDEADQLEKAVDSTFASAPRQLTAPEDPLGLEAAFDQLFPPDSDAQGVQESSSDSNDEGSADPADSSDDEAPASEVDSDDAWGELARHDDADMESDVEEDGDGVRKAMRTSQHFRQDGKKIFWRDVQIGALTEWHGSVSCHCRIHSSCKTPASTKYESDVVLIDWLLSGIDHSGTKRMEKGTHIQHAAAVAALARARH